MNYMPSNSYERESENSAQDLRDSLVLISMALSDHLRQSASPLRDEVLAQVQRHLARIRASDSEPHSSDSSCCWVWPSRLRVASACGVVGVEAKSDLAREFRR
jgi:hypothetical protein